MRLTSTSVQRLLNASERALVDSVSASAIADLTPARLRSKIERTRRLKDKYATQARARGRAARGKAASSRAATRTDRETMAAKVEVFDAVLDRLTRQLEKAERRTARATTKTAKTAKTVKSAKKTAKKTAKTTAKTAAKRTAKTTAKKTAPTSAAAKRTVKKATKKTTKKTTRKATKKTAPRAAASDDKPPITKGEARALVARVKQRVAEMTGDPAAIVAQADESGPVPAATEAANTSVEARSHDARAATVEQHFAATHQARAQGHAGARTQRVQGKRDS